MKKQAAIMSLFDREEKDLIQIYVDQADVSAKAYEGYTYIQLLTAENGCLAGCRTGLLMYTQEEYGQSNTHEDQEGFYVLEGTGEALIGDNELMLHPGICFIVPPSFCHSIKKDADCDYIKLFFFHAAV